MISQNIFIPADLQVVNIILIYRKITQKKKMRQIDALIIFFFSQKSCCKIQYINGSTAVEVCKEWCTISKMQPQYENMHTREQSVPSFCSRCGDPPSPSHCNPQLTQHTVHVRGPRKHNICQCTNLHNEHQRKKDIYTPQNGLVFNKHFTSHENTVKNTVCANLPFKLLDSFFNDSDTI